MESRALTYLLGGAGALQAVLTGLGLNNGGIAAFAADEFELLVIGLIAVLVAVLIGVLVLIWGGVRGGKRRLPWPQLATTAGVLLLFFGIGVTGYAAVVGPTTAKAPDIDATLTGSSSTQLVLTAHVKASGIKEDSVYRVRVLARKYVKGKGVGRYVPFDTPIYEAQLGANGQGAIDITLTVPLPLTDYDAVSIEAWNGPHAGPCGSLAGEGGADLTRTVELAAKVSKEEKEQQEKLVKEKSRIGCVVIRLPHDHAAKKKPHKKQRHKKRHHKTVKRPQSARSRRRPARARAQRR